MVSWLVSWCRGITVSRVQTLEDFCKNTLFAILAIFFNDVINGNAGDFILTRPDTPPFIGIFNIGEQIFFIYSEPVGRRFFSDLLHGFAYHFKNIGIRSWRSGITVA